MTNETEVGPLRFVFLTALENEPVLNIQPTPDDEISRYRLTYRQLLMLNDDIADALLRGGKS
jgi:hypothetical protein